MSTTLDIYITPLQFTDGPSRIYLLTLGPITEPRSTFYYVADFGTPSAPKLRRYIDPKKPSIQSSMEVRSVGVKPVWLGAVSAEKKGDVLHVADEAVRSDLNVGGMNWPSVFGRGLKEEGILDVDSDVLDEAGVCQCWGAAIGLYVYGLCLKAE